ncbi:heme exporter protein CcmD [Pasteurellaceae bacterium LIM206]|nr:heme exporter protein CcmD [Pasteurellaceae bacterium LIM206]
MFFQSWHDFFNMGGYGFYVWLAYGISFVILLWLTLSSYRGKRAVLNEIRREQQREQRLQAHRTGGTL